MDERTLHQGTGRRIGAALGAIVGVYLLAGIGTRLAVDALWFDEVGHLGVFRTRLASQVALAVLGFAVAFSFLTVTLRSAIRRSPSLRLGVRGDLELSMLQLERRLPLLVTIGAGVVAFGLAATLAQEWLTIQSFFRRVPYGMTDPVFSRDLGFYLFGLPALRLVHGWLFLLVLLGIFGTTGVYAVRGGLIDRQGIARPARTHLGLLAVGFLILLALHFVLSQFDVLFSPTGAVFGAGYMDIHAALPGIRVLVVVAVLAAGILAYSLRRGSIRWMLAGPGLLLLAYLAASVVIPGTLQRFVVEPNELLKERPYIEHGLRFTREAFDLEDIEERNFQFETIVDASVVESHATTIENIRLWDWRPLLATYRQIQEIRSYYNFGDVDVDRYEIGGRYRQVMLSARELAYDQLDEDKRKWVNLHLKYTHGYGVCMSPVNEITREGLPELLIRDIPPAGTADIQVTRPEVYFGEQTSVYALVGTTEDEFDYPTGDANEFTRYSGSGGIGIGSLLRRLLFAWHLRSRELLFTSALTAESRILLNRRILERVERVAPFLLYDRDPYLVLHDGRMVWVLDAYTTSNRFPYSQPTGNLNYIRNAVKVAIDAYDGTTTFYAADPDDPVLRVYSNIFPHLFRPLDEMPADLRAHLRYPVDLFRIQAEMFATFHMDDSQVFYNREDLWQLPMESFEGREIIMEPYYTIMRLPDSESAEMVLMLPFTPSRRDNMIAWMAARCDGANLGRRMVFLFPKQELIYGPRQIEARIDQDAEISQELTLWSQRGSNVSRGNLLVIPLGNSVLYVEPLYLSAEKGALPELKRVIVSLGNRIAMDVNLESALSRLFESQIALPQTARDAELADTQPSSPTPMIGEGSPAARQALEILRAADDALQRRDWTAYGEAMERLRRHLEAQVSAGPS